MNFGKLAPWFEFFRVPNLGTAAGDSIVGASLCAALGLGEISGRVLAGVGLSSFLFYLFGLADNDVSGAKNDKFLAPHRPIPSGKISLPSAVIAESVCLVAGFAVGFLFRLPTVWWYQAGILVALILAYNRMKDRVGAFGLALMGLCRAGSLACGASAVLAGAWPCGRPTMALGVVGIGWVAYIAGVTLLGKNEMTHTKAMGTWRYLLALAALIPLVAFAFAMPKDATLVILPVIGSVFTAIGWVSAVSPLGVDHDSLAHRKAVGRTVGAFLYMQIGFMLVTVSRETIVAALACWCVARIAKRIAPSVTGS